MTVTVWMTKCKISLLVRCRCDKMMQERVSAPSGPRLAAQLKGHSVVEVGCRRRPRNATIQPRSAVLAAQNLTLTCTAFFPAPPALKFAALMVTVEANECRSAVDLPLDSVAPFSRRNSSNSFVEGRRRFSCTSEVQTFLLLQRDQTPFFLVRRSQVRLVAVLLALDST